MRRAAPSSFATLLTILPTRRMRRRLARCIPQLDFMGGRPPRFLFVSGRRNRCNSAGVGCLYFAESERTAHTEYGQQWQGTVAEFQPKVTFFARVSLRRVLDLSNEDVIDACGLTTADQARSRGQSIPRPLSQSAAQTYMTC